MVLKLDTPKQHVKMVHILALNVLFCAAVRIFMRQPLGYLQDKEYACSENLFHPFLSHLPFSFWLYFAPEPLLETLVGSKFISIQR